MTWYTTTYRNKITKISLLPHYSLSLVEADIESEDEISDRKRETLLNVLDMVTDISTILWLQNYYTWSFTYLDTLKNHQIMQFDLLLCCRYQCFHHFSLSLVGADIINKDEISDRTREVLLNVLDMVTDCYLIPCTSLIFWLQNYYTWRFTYLDTLKNHQIMQWLLQFDQL